ncbi:MAG: tetratricopeptide repeat protein [Phycisphaerales bacterium]
MPARSSRCASLHPPLRSSRRFVATATLLGAFAVVGACGPKPIVVLKQDGEFNFKYGNYEDAAKDFGEIIERTPGDWEAEYRYGQCMMQLGDLNAARRSLEIASTAVPNNDEVAYALADCYFKLGDQTRLYQLLRDRAESTGSADAWVRMSEYALRFDDLDMANTAALAAIEVDDGKTAVPYYQAALVDQRLNQKDEAIRRLRQAYGINPDDTRVKTMLVQYGEVPGPTLALPPGK